MTPRKKKWLAWILVVYLVLLGCSHLKRILDPLDPAPSKDQKVFQAQGFGEDTGEEISIAYLDTGPRDGIPVLLIHGSPVGTRVFGPLIDELPDDLRLIAPDLPGHGNSDREVEDASFKADANYLHQLFLYLDLPPVHLIAYSRGGGPALQWKDEYPHEVKSLVLLSSIGVQEHELLGDYTLNHALHSLQYWAFVLAEELIPHFGYLDDAVLNSDYARSFYDSDQRPLRKILTEIDTPTLIIHGTRDPLVPPRAAQEHHRIVPQSELVEMPGGHLLVTQQAKKVAGKVVDFVHRSEAGVARVRQAASPSRLLAAAEAQSENPTPATGRGLLFLAIILAAATLISEDLTCVIAGLLAAAGTLSFSVATLACFVGIIIGDLLIFFSGRFFGATAVRHPPIRWFLDADRLASAQKWFIKRGAVVILITRFVPGSRLAVYFAAGMARVNVARFLVYFIIAALLWTPFLVGISMLVGDPILQSLAKFEHWALPLLVGVILLILFVVKGVAPLFTHRGRRIAYGSWRRKIRWEFWPRWLFYAPVVPWVILLGLRYRKPSLFTAANPGMEAGGIAFESKREIYRLLRQGNGKIARTLALEPDKTISEWEAQVSEFQTRLDQDFPIVCKPDMGERGDGVTIIKKSEELSHALKVASPSPIVQEFVTGNEYGIFFEKKASETTGRITSITRKIHTSVRGDGESSLEELILSDDRAVCYYSYFRKLHHDNLSSVPADGERFELAPLGSHCRGSLFLDGSDLLSEGLVAAINQIFTNTRGLCFGRLDVKSPSDSDLKNGLNITVLEFNGITSEPTHIYDPKHSLLFAYRTLFAQWRRAFELSAENFTEGHIPCSKRETIRILLDALLGRDPKKKRKKIASESGF